jgi:hypothetical protein
MRQHRYAIAALIIGASAPVAPAFAQICGCPSGGGYIIQSDEPPPPLPVYDQPPLPAPGYYWTPGYWAWNNYDYYWVPGAWVEPPQPGLLWTPGYWAFAAGVYAFRPGYWGPHVGFYGGVDYGFGYNGAGYFGGRWDNGRYVYNSAVNNLGPDHIANTYNQAVVSAMPANRASFNGGPGGLAAKPTNEELLAEKESHIPASKLQVDQARASSVRGEQFVSANQGKPAIAATQRPGEFKGQGVVPAKAAGKAIQAATPVGGDVQPESREKLPPGEKPGKLEGAPSAPKTEERRPPAEGLAKPEVAPPVPKVEERLPPGLVPHSPKIEKPPTVEKLAKPEAAPSAPKIERPPAVEKLAKPEAPPPTPKVEQRPPAGLEKLPAPNGAQRAMERPPVPVVRKPEVKECGRPGLPPCPR